MEQFLGVVKFALLVVAKHNDNLQKYSRSHRHISSLELTLGLASSAYADRDTFV